MGTYGSWEVRRNQLFEYDPSRSSEVPIRLFQDFEGYLQVDGYDAYNAVTKLYPIKRVGCFAHLRRKFVEAINCLPVKSRKTHSAFAAIKFIKSLYEIENQNLEQNDRKEKALAVLQSFKEWIHEKTTEVPPKSAYGRALAYGVNEWKYLVRYVDHKDLSPDNNRAENAIRPFVIGRKNWLFSDTDKGARASASLYSLIETAKANGLEPHAYMKKVISNIPSAKNLEDFEALLPYK